MMANKARAVTVAVTVAALACCRAFAAGQDDAPGRMTVFDGMSADELTSLPPAADAVNAVFSMAAGLAPPSANRPTTGDTNIQKVHRTAKAVMDPAAMTAGADNETAVTAASPSDLEWLLNVYNPHRWNPVMLPAASMLSVQCRDVMRIYLEALRNESFWAAKSELRHIDDYY